ncbi:MAG: hypothetical protein ABW092_09730 [Candidatus Thiodiazotropha sp.]
MVEPVWTGQALPDDVPGDYLRSCIQTALTDNTALKLAMSFTLNYFLLGVARRGNPHKLKIFVEEGFPLNFQHHETGASVLHILAAGGARPAIRELLKSDTIEFLFRDKQGRLPSELAYLYGRDVAMARLLGIKERKQAGAKGIKLTRRPKGK